MEKDFGEVLHEEFNKVEEYYVPNEKEHIIWDSEISDDDFDMEQMKDLYKDYCTDLQGGEVPEFDEWFEDYRGDNYDVVWDWKEDDLKENILPEIDKQLNYGYLMLCGGYNSNYPDFRPSGNGGVDFEGAEEFRDYMSRFDRVAITSTDGVLGAICGDHDGTVAGQFYTLPEKLTELAKAMNYQDQVDIEEVEGETEEDRWEAIMDQFEEDILYGSLDYSDFKDYLEYMVPVKDTISIYGQKTESKLQETRIPAQKLIDKYKDADKVTIKEITDDLNSASPEASDETINGLLGQVKDGLKDLGFKVSETELVKENKEVKTEAEEKMYLDGELFNKYEEEVKLDFSNADMGILRLMYRRLDNLLMNVYDNSNADNLEENIKTILSKADVVVNDLPITNTLNEAFNLVNVVRSIVGSKLEEEFGYDFYYDNVYESKQIKTEIASRADKDMLEAMNKFIKKNKLDPKQYRAGTFRIRMKDIPPQEVAGIITEYNGMEYGFRYLAGQDIWTITLIQTGASVSGPYDYLTDAINDLPNIDKKIDEYVQTNGGVIDQMTDKFNYITKAIDDVYKAGSVPALIEAVKNIKGLPENAVKDIIDRINNNLQGDFTVSDYEDVQDMVVAKLQKIKEFNESKKVESSNRKVYVIRKDGKDKIFSTENREEAVAKIKELRDADKEHTYNLLTIRPDVTINDMARELYNDAVARKDRWGKSSEN